MRLQLRLHIVVVVMVIGRQRTMAKAAFCRSLERSGRSDRGTRQGRTFSVVVASTTSSTDNAPHPWSSSSSLLVLNDKPIQTVMAPMVAASDYPFRRLVRRYGVDLCYTQMLLAKHLVGDPMFRRGHLDFCDWHMLAGPNQKDCDKRYLKSQCHCVPQPINPTLYEEIAATHTEGGPLIVQIAGNDPELLVDGAEKVLSMAPDGVVTGFDLNLGCPQGIARKGRYGAFLFEDDQDAVFESLKRLRERLPSSVKVSAKIRLPVDDDASDSRLKYRIEKLIEYSGVDFITVHGRTLLENKTRVTSCHFDKIRVAVETAQQCRAGFPIIANGGIEDYNSVNPVLQETGATAVMSSEALLETPNIFAVPPPTTARDQFDQQIGLTREYLDLVKEHPPFPCVLGPAMGSFNIVRGHLFKFLHRYVQKHDDLRERLVSHDTTNVQHALSLVDDLEDRYDNDETLEACVSSRPDSSWYRRHWNIKAEKFIHERRGPVQQQDRQQGSDTMSTKDKKLLMQERIQRLKEQKLKRKGAGHQKGLLPKVEQTPIPATGAAEK